MREKAANTAANKARAKQRKLEADEDEEHEWQATAACVEEARQEQARQDAAGAQEVERQAAEAKAATATTKRNALAATERRRTIGVESEYELVAIAAALEASLAVEARDTLSPQRVAGCRPRWC